MVSISINKLSKTFYNNNNITHVLKDISLEIKKGEVVGIRGDNGTGKTTLLNLIAKIDYPTAGNLSYSDTKAIIGYVQQDYTSALLPWYSVLENIAIPLKLRGIKKSERIKEARRVVNDLEFLKLPLNKYPSQLSGGQKQRVTIARALIHNPSVLILDEPFANIDAHSQLELQKSINRIHEKYNLTILLVSHGLDECISLTDRIILLYGSPATLYKEYDIRLKRPRYPELLYSKDFIDIRNYILREESNLYV